MMHIVLSVILSDRLCFGLRTAILITSSVILHGCA